MIRIFLFTLLLTPVLATADTIKGEWIPPGGNALLRITVDDSAEIELVRTFEALVDRENPNVKLKSRPLAQLRIGRAFQATGDSWTGGTLYDPGKGRSYHATLKLVDADHLEVRGYVGIPAFGRSQIWTRKSLYEQQLCEFLDLACQP